MVRGVWTDAFATTPKRSMAGWPGMRPWPMFTMVTLVLVSLAGCVEDEPEPDIPAEPEPEPIVLEALQFAPSLRIGAPEPLGIGGEPSIATAPDGTIYISAPIIAYTDLATGFVGGGFGQGRIWRSTDGGATFDLLNDENGRLTPDDGGNGDTDIAVDALGHVYFVDLAGGVPFLYSRDQGDTWTSGGELNDPDRPVDRQWIDAHGDGFLAATWAAQDGEPRGITFTRSFDGGETWQRPPDIVDGMIQLGPVEIAPNGRHIYQPYVTSGGYELRIAVSADQGANWTDVSVGPQLLPPPGDAFGLVGGGWSPSVIFPVAMADAVGGVHLVWSQYHESGGTHLMWVRSLDHGMTWSEPVMLSPPTGNAVLPWVSVGHDGRVAAVYLRSETDDHPSIGMHEWTIQVVASANARDANVSAVTWATSLVQDDPVHTGALCPHGGGCAALGMAPVYDDRRLLDFFESAILPDGRLVVTWTQTEDMEGRNPTVRFAVQSGGTLLRG